MKTPISYYGGKQTILRHLLPLIPEHDVYTEAFMGGAALFFAKEPVKVEVLNDVNSNLVNFFRQLKTNYSNLKLRIDGTLHSREEHEYASIVYDFGKFFDKTERAWALWVLSKQSFASKLDGTWGYDRQKNTVGKKIMNSRESFTHKLSDRLAMTQIECTDGLRVISSRDCIQAFHFIDPPYINTDMGHYKGYNEMDFINLLEILKGLKGKFMLTMFPNEILKEYIDENEWKVESIERTISASKNKRRKQKELIVMNY